MTYWVECTVSKPIDGTTWKVAYWRVGLTLGGGHQLKVQAKCGSLSLGIYRTWGNRSGDGKAAEHESGAHPCGSEG